MRTVTSAVRVVTMAVAVILAACSSAPTTSSGPTSAPTAAETDVQATASTPPTQSAPPRASSPSPTIDPFAYDPALVTQLMGDGMSEAEALFAAMTRAEVVQISPLSYRITESFPTGNSAEFTVTLTPDQASDPDAPAILASYTDARADFGFRLEYLIAYDDMPDDVEQEIRGASADVVAPVVLAGFTGAVLPIGAQSAGVGVVAEGVAKKFAGNQVSNFLTFLEGKLGTGGTLGNLYKSIKALLSVRDALAMQSEFDELERQINALKDCAENPTNPVTRNAYRDDPGYKQRILDQVEATRTEVKANTAVMFLGLINSTASSLVKVKWLGYVVGPLTAWSKATLQQLNAQLMAELKASITPCEGYQFELSGSGPTRYLDPPAGGSVTVSYHFWGLLCPDSAEWKIWEHVESHGLWGDGPTAETFPPGAGSLPLTATFSADGTMIASSWTGINLNGTTIGGSYFTLSPPHEPTTVTAYVTAGDTRYYLSPVSAPVVRMDGSFGSCEGG